MKKRILFYNWAPFDDHAHRGGGVSVYLKNLIEVLSQRHDLEIVFLSSGKEYSLLNRRCRVEPTKNVFASRGVRSFAIFNSPVKAPAHDMFQDIADWRSDQVTARVFRAFLRKEGPFDAVNFHNLEGISSAVLALRTEFPETRFLLTWHNYIPLCPQVDLLFQSKRDCGEFADGMKCIGCIGRLERRRSLLPFDRVGSTLERAGIGGKPLGNYLFDMARAGIFYVKAHKHLITGLIQGVKDGFRSWKPRRPSPAGFPRIDPLKMGPRLRLSSSDSLKAKAEAYRDWREVNTALANSVLDGNLVVSDVVRETIVGYGVKPEKVTVTPLGMDIHASPEEMRGAFAGKPARPRLVFSFIGYGNPSKGLHFMADALELANEPSFRSDAELVVVAKLSEVQQRQLVRLERYFHKVTWIPGYSREQLPQIARMIDVNIVPSIWRETYNQVGFELLCLGTPSILASKVGLSMFYQNKGDFLFPTGDGAALVDRMRKLVEDRGRVERFWDAPVLLPRMEEHAETVLRGLLGQS